MILTISDKFRITSDEMQWTVQQSFNQEKGGKGWKNVGYYSSLSGAVNAAFQRGLRCSEATTLRDALNDAQKQLDELTHALAPEIKVVKVI